jgi:hypothetical protein
MLLLAESDAPLRAHDGRRMAARAARHADSLPATSVPGDTIRAGCARLVLHPMSEHLRSLPICTCRDLSAHSPAFNYPDQRIVSAAASPARHLYSPGLGGLRTLILCKGTCSSILSKIMSRSCKDFTSRRFSVYFCCHGIGRGKYGHDGGLRLQRSPVGRPRIRHVYQAVTMRESG